MTSSKLRLVNKKEPLNKSTNHSLICYLRVGRGWARGERAPGLLGARPGTDLTPPPLGRGPGSWERGAGTSRHCHHSGTDPAPLLLAPHPAGPRDTGDGERGWGGSLQRLQEAGRRGSSTHGCSGSNQDRAPAAGPTGGLASACSHQAHPQGATVPLGTEGIVLSPPHAAQGAGP